MSDQYTKIYNALRDSPSLSAREQCIATRAWILAKESHAALSSAWTASREKVRLAENDSEDKAYWAKIEAVRAQHALIDKFDQEKEELAQSWRPNQVIYVDDNDEDTVSGDAAREGAAKESSSKTANVRNMPAEKSAQTSDDMSASFQASTTALLQLGLDKIVGLEAIVTSAGSVSGGRKKQGNKRWADDKEAEFSAAKRRNPGKPCSTSKNQQIATGVRLKDFGSKQLRAD